MASIGLQVHGGMGYVEETGVAQYWRDSRIAPIYEGTNGIQAIDLVTRKIPMRDGGVVTDLLAQIEVLDRELAAADPELAGIRPALASGVSAVRDATDWIMSHGAAEPNDALAGATPYLRLFGLVVGGWLLARSALAASRLRPARTAPTQPSSMTRSAPPVSMPSNCCPRQSGCFPQSPLAPDRSSGSISAGRPSGSRCRRGSCSRSRRPARRAGMQAASRA